MDEKNKSKIEGGILADNSILNVQAQKELMDYGAKIRMRQSIKTLFIVLPTIGLFVCLLLYVVYKFLGII